MGAVIGFGTAVREAEQAQAARRFMSMLEARGDARLVEALSLLPLLEQISCAFTVKDRQGRYVFANSNAMRLLGVSQPEALFGVGFADDALQLDQAAVQEVACAEAQLLAGMIEVLEIEVPLPAGGWLHATKTPWRDASGELIGILTVGRDVTDHRQAEFLRRRHAAILEQIARGHPLMAVLQGLVGLVEAQLNGITASILSFDPQRGLLSPAAGPGLPADYSALLEGLEPGENVGSCGTAAWLRQPVIVADTFKDRRWQDYAHVARAFGLRSCWSTPVLDPSGHLLGTFALYSREVREPSAEEMELTAMATDLAAIAMARARAEEQIRHLAMHDPLTGLPNRRMFVERFDELIADARRYGRHVVVAYLDLDDFKGINDTHGHAAGDCVLKEVAARLGRGVRAYDLTVRLGGDEFAVAMACAPADEQSVRTRLQSLHEALVAPVRIDAGDVFCGCSMGVAVFPQCGETAEELLGRADAAMYEAKRGAGETLSGGCVKMRGPRGR